MELTRRTEILEGDLARHLTWIAAADGKTGFIFAVATAMLGLLASAAPKYGEWTTAGVLLGASAALALVSCLGCVVAAVFPRTKGPKLSLIFFGAVASRTIDEFRTDVDAITEETYVEDLVQQCHVNAEIASVKFRWLKWAGALLAICVLPWVAAAYVLFRDK